MALSTLGMRRAIIDLLEGSIDSVRRLEIGKFRYGAFTGQTDTAIQARIVQGGHWFDVRFLSVRSHPATSVSATGNRRIAVAEIAIPLWTNASTTIQEEDRSAVLSDIMSDLEDACQALHFPNNLSADKDGNTNEIVDGLLQGPNNTSDPEFRIVREDWDAQLIQSEITASAILAIAQAVA